MIQLRSIGNGDFSSKRVDCKNADACTAGNRVTEQLAGVRIRSHNVADRCAVGRILGHIKHLVADHGSMLIEVQHINVEDPSNRAAIVTCGPNRDRVAFVCFEINERVVGDRDYARHTVDRKSSTSVVVKRIRDRICCRIQITGECSQTDWRTGHRLLANLVD